MKWTNVNRIRSQKKIIKARLAQNVRNYADKERIIIKKRHKKDKQRVKKKKLYHNKKIQEQWD